MKKLKLDLDQIQVSSFAVETTESGSGTVNGFSTTFNTNFFSTFTFIFISLSQY